MPPSVILSLSLTEAVERLDDKHMPKGDLGSSSQVPSQSWDLNCPFEEARRLAREGWSAKIEDFHRLTAEIVSLAVQGLSSTVWDSKLDVAGESVDVGTYLSGEPECMLSMISTGTKACRFVVNLSARYSAPGDVLMNRGIAVAAIIHILQSQGHGISLVACGPVTSGNNCGDMHDVRVEISRHGDYLDPGTLAFWLAHPAALRRCFLRYEEQQPPEIRNTFGFKQDGGYGYPCNSTPDSDDYNAYYLPFPDEKDYSSYSTPQEAFRTVRAILEKQGITIEANAA